MCIFPFIHQCDYYNVLNVSSSQAFPYSPGSHLFLVRVTGLGVHHSHILCHCSISWFLFLSLICISKHYFIAHHLSVPDRPLLRTTALRRVPSGPPSINIRLDNQGAIKPWVRCRGGSGDAGGLSSCYKITVTGSDKSFKHLTHVWTATQH